MSEATGGLIQRISTFRSAMHAPSSSRGARQCTRSFRSSWRLGRYGIRDRPIDRQPWLRCAQSRWQSILTQLVDWSWSLLYVGQETFSSAGPCGPPSRAAAPSPPLWTSVVAALRIISGHHRCPSSWCDYLQRPRLRPLPTSPHCGFTTIYTIPLGFVKGLAGAASCSNSERISRLRYG